jgi:ABC-type microcin C transport system duplicated ATPase subunit YejF
MDRPGASSTRPNVNRIGASASLECQHESNTACTTQRLGVIRQIAERIYVVYRGEIVEEGPTEHASAPVYASAHRFDPHSASEGAT